VTLRILPEQLLREVDLLYRKEFLPTQLKEIENHCEFIAEYIRACGYSEEEYIRLMSGIPLEDHSSN
jgi:hypothetical protein